MRVADVYKAGPPVTKPEVEHHPFLSPSKFPALAHCIHYESKPVGPAAMRGIAIHERTACLLRGEGLGSVLMTEAEEAAAAEWCAEQVRKIFREGAIEGIEEKVTLYDEFGSVVTFGTADCWGRDSEGRLVLVDYKTGGERDYSQQFAVYALALIKRLKLHWCRVITLYADQKLQREVNIDRVQASRIVYHVVDRVRAGTEPPKENYFCNWCAKKQTCPVWTKPASDALATVNVFGSLLSLKDDPERLGAFLAKWKKAETLVEEADLKNHAKALLEEGIDVPGWRLQDRKGRSSCDIEALKTVWTEAMEGIPVPMKTGPPIKALVQTK